MAGSTQMLNGTSRAVPASQTQSAAAQDLWIFRDGKLTTPGKDLLENFQRRIRKPLVGSDLVDALIEAGELEAALADSTFPCDTAARITDTLAAMLCGRFPESSTQMAAAASQIEVPAQLSVSPPEGFTYYALHPGDFARVVSRIPAEPKPCAVLGIRSIGTTLSAVVLAAVLGAGRQGSRITVRPEGHPYFRRMDFSPQQLAWIERHPAAQFLVVDEGPGRSGSTFLSVAEALVRAGVPAERITLLGSRQPDIDSLCADDAAQRWAPFRFVATTPSVDTRFSDCTYVGGGEWRRFLLPPDMQWPESWTQMERLKFVSPDLKHLHKFEGMGPIGAEVRTRAFHLAEAGFGPRVCDVESGFLSYSYVAGRPMQAHEANGELLERIAQYCAFRNAEFSSVSSGPPQMQQMLEFNVAQEFGVALSLEKDDFLSDRPVVCDGRMQPYEWIETTAGQIIKVDGVDHGDNHFFPGRCDIAWDVAGAAVEWHLSKDGAADLLQRFRLRSGVDVSAKFELYKLAYLVFRLGFCKMALSTAKGSPEESLLGSAYHSYRASALQLLEKLGFRRQAA